MPSLVDTPDTTTACREHLVRLLSEWQQVAIATSGGVDSIMLAAVAVEVLGPDRVLLLNARSPAFPPDEAAYVAAFAARIGAHLEVVDTEELSVEDYTNNPPTRCYHCRTEMYGRMRPIAERLGYTILLDGANVDDRGDFRPGMKAADEQAVQHPLITAGFGKAEIRELAHRMNLAVWDKPAFSCLASRFPYGEHIDATKLARVQKAEAAMRALSFRIFRVRSHDSLARIEVAADELAAAFESRHQIIAAIRECGYDFVTLDLEGFRSGSMNEPLLRRGPHA